MKKLILFILLCGLVFIPSIALNGAEVSLNSESYRLQKQSQLSTNHKKWRTIRYTKKMIKLIKKYSALSIEIANDGKIDDNEAVAVIKMSNDITDMGAKIDKYFLENPSAKELSIKYMDDHKAEIDIIYEVFLKAMTDLYECEGFEKTD